MIKGMFIRIDIVNDGVVRVYPLKWKFRRYYQNSDIYSRTDYFSEPKTRTPTVV